MKQNPSSATAEQWEMNTGSAGTERKCMAYFIPELTLKPRGKRSNEGDEWARSTHEMEVHAYKVQVGKPERKRPPGRSGCRWQD
jgi:hypothetical protein